MKPLLIKEIDEKKTPEQNYEYIRESFRRIEFFLNNIGAGGDSFVSNLVNIIQNTGDTIWERGTDSVPSSTSKNIDVVNLNDFYAIKYILVLYNVANQLTKKVEVSIIKKGTQLEDSITAKLGNGLDVEVNANVSSGSLQLQIVNNEAFQIEVAYAKLELV